MKNSVLWPNVREPEAWALPFWSQSLFETAFYFHFSELGRHSNSVWRRKNNIQENLRLSICKTISWAGNLKLLSVILTNLLWLSGTIMVVWMQIQINFYPIVLWQFIGYDDDGSSPHFSGAKYSRPFPSCLFSFYD